MAHDCKDENCHLKSSWTETNDNGELVFCFKVRHHGKSHTQRYTLREIAEILNQKVKAQTG